MRRLGRDSGACAFFLGQEHRSFDRYGVTPSRQGNIYRFIDGPLKTKSDGQLDKALNGYVYTFDPDPRHAEAVFLERAESDVVRARTALESARLFLEEIRSLRH